MPKKMGDRSDNTGNWNNLLNMLIAEPSAQVTIYPRYNRTLLIELFSIEAHSWLPWSFEHITPSACLRPTSIQYVCNMYTITN